MPKLILIPAKLYDDLFLCEKCKRCPKYFRGKFGKRKEKNFRISIYLCYRCWKIYCYHIESFGYGLK